MAALWTVMLVATLAAVACQITTDNFGPYNMVFEKFASCRGPKQRTCGKVLLGNTKNMSDVIFDMDFTQNCPVTMARVTIGIKQDNNSTKKLWNYSLEQPCQHFVLGPILTGSFNLSSSCRVNKGSYQIHMNMADKCEEFLGPSFFYGRYVFKVMAYNKVSNFFCVENHMGIEKRSGSGS